MIFPGQSVLQGDLIAFLQQSLPGVEVVEGYDNRVPQPQGPRFVTVWPVLRAPLSTTLVLWADVSFRATIAERVMNVVSMAFGTIKPGSSLWTTELDDGWSIVEQIDGDVGGVGTYVVDAEYPVRHTSPMAAGNVMLTQPIDLGFQVEVFSTDIGDASDMIETVRTLFRSEVGVRFFAGRGHGASPLYTDDPRLMPFSNAEAEWDMRYVMTAHIEAYQTIQSPMQFADTYGVRIVKAGV